MIRTGSLVLAFIATIASSSAQQIASANLTAQQTASANLTMLTAQLRSAGCPISVYAQRRSIPTMYSAARDPRSERHGQGLHLTLNRLEAPEIVKANVTVHGTSFASRLIPVDSRSREEVTETFELVRTPETATLTRASLWTEKIGSVQWLEITSLEYADGTAWHQAKESRCRATPDGLLLVAGQ